MEGNYIFTTMTPDYRGSLQGAVRARIDQVQLHAKIWVEVNLQDHTCHLCGGWFDGGGVHSECADSEQARADAETEARLEA